MCGIWCFVLFINGHSVTFTPIISEGHDSFNFKQKYKVFKKIEKSTIQQKFHLGPPIVKIHRMINYVTTKQPT